MERALILDWITDPHLDHLRSKEALISFIKELHKRESDALLITGDIAESHTIKDYLGILSGAYQRPIYFVLGNHDYYGGWIEATQRGVQDVCKSVPSGILNWMPDTGCVSLTPDVFLVGHGGLYDAQEGGGVGIDMVMTDLYFPKGIYDLAIALRQGTHYLFEALQNLANSCAEHIEHSIQEALQAKAKKVIVLTHVPPFLEASYFRGQPCELRMRPWYVNRTLGDKLLAISKKYSNVDFIVLAGHTHGKRSVSMRHNLHVHVGSSRYGYNPRYAILDTSNLESFTSF